MAKVGHQIEASKKEFESGKLQDCMRILHLEDSADDAELIANRLKDEGISCQVTRVDSRDAFLAAAMRGDWDVILADYTLPSFDGISALQIAREKCPQVPFIFVSGALGEEVAITTLKSGATDYILKDRLARLPLAVTRAVEERAAAEERKRSQALLDLRTKALESAANGIVITDREGTIIWANAACEALAGYRPGELLGQNPRILKSGRQDPKFYENLWVTILGGQVWHGEIVNRHKNGTLYTEEMTITPVRDAQGSITSFVAIKQDVTERRELEERLRQAQKMEAIGRLAGGMAHDFNNLLTVITGYSDMLLEDPGASPTQCAQEIRNAGERAAALTRQLLTFSRRQVLQPRVLNLNETVGNMEGLLRRLLGENLDLVLVPGEALGSVKADPTQIEQIIMNLAVNARDAMPRGGRLVIETANVSLDEASCNNDTGVSPGSYVRLRVSDNGQGMNEQIRARLFEPFFTTKDKGKGTGLGLATVYGIVKQSGGAISVESEPNKGSVFTIHFPLVAEKSDAIQTGPSPQRGSKGSGVVLLVEDEQAVRALARSILESGGYTVLECGDPNEALRLFGKCPPAPIDLIDLLLTDVVMPQMSGITLAERLLPLHREMKVMYMSGYSDELLQQQGVRSSSAFIPKPFTPAGLLNKVREVLKGPVIPQRRQYGRVDCLGLEASCEWSAHHSRARGVNLSEGGILLQNAHEPIPLHQSIVLALKPPNGEQARSLRGQVVRNSPAGQFAVKFEDLSITERAALRQIIANQSGSDPASIPYV